MISIASLKKLRRFGQELLDIYTKHENNLNSDVEEYVFKKIKNIGNYILYIGDRKQCSFFLET